MPSAADAEKRGKKSLRLARDMIDSGDDGAASDLLLAGITQFVRAALIQRGVFPASRPELPQQLRDVDPRNQLAELLDEAMFENGDVGQFVTIVESKLQEVRDGRVANDFRISSPTTF